MAQEWKVCLNCKDKTAYQVIFVSLFWRTLGIVLMGQLLLKWSKCWSFASNLILICGNLLIQWRREVAFAGFDVPIQMDVSADKMIFGVAGVDPKRRDELIKV